MYGQELEGGNAVEADVLSFVEHTHAPINRFNHVAGRKRSLDESFGFPRSGAILGPKLWQVNERRRLPAERSGNLAA